MKKQPSANPHCSNASWFLFFFVTLSLLSFSACAHTDGGAEKQTMQKQPFTGDAEILASWQGDYSVEGLAVLPEEAAYPGIGYIADAAALEAVWEAFDTEEVLPEIDFERESG